MNNNVNEIKQIMHRLLEEQMGAPMTAMERLILDITFERTVVLPINLDANTIAQIAVVAYNTANTVIKPLAKEIMLQTNVQQLTIHYDNQTIVVWEDWAAGSAPPA